MPKFLQVPLVMQPRDKAWCGPACAGMVNAYLTGKEIPLRKIACEFTVPRRMIDRNGCYYFDVGSWLLSQGVMSEVREDRERHRTVRCVRSMKRYLAVDGTLVSKRLRRPRILRELSQKRPIIAHVDVNHLHGIRGEKPAGHFVVLVGATRSKVWYLDPLESTLQVRPWKKFWHAATVSGFDMILFPKRLRQRHNAKPVR